MICPNCGKELAEDEVCTCQQNNQPNEQNNQTYEPNTPPQGAYFDSAAAQQNYYEQSRQQTQGAYYDPNTQQYYSPDMNGNFYPPIAQIMPPRTDYPEGYKIKKKYVAVLLAWALGPLGIHNFYLGNNSKGIAQVLLSTIGALLFVGPIISCVWAIVEAVQLLTEKIDRDADGYKIRTLEDFIEQKIDNKNA